MQEVWQGYLESESVSRHSEQFQRFTVTKSKVIPGLISSLILFPAWFIAMANGYSHNFNSFFLQILFIYLVVVIDALIFSRYFKREQILEIYDDKLIIKRGENDKVIMFSEVKKYYYLGQYYYTPNSVCIRTNELIRIYGDSKGLHVFFDALEMRLQQFTSENRLQIETNDRFAIPDYVIPVVIISGVLILVIAVFLLLWHGAFKHDYSWTPLIHKPSILSLHNHLILFTRFHMPNYLTCHTK